MGNLNGKNVKYPEEYNITSSLTSTPKLQMVHLDPRSPSANIIRTPIQSNNTPVIGVINSMDLNVDDGLINIDPRSPSVEFTRTPITFDNKTNKMLYRHLNILQRYETMTPTKLRTPIKNIDHNEDFKTDNDTEKLTDTIRKPKLLSVTSITKKFIDETSKPTVGLLETNFDFIDTNSDSIVSTSNKNSVSDIEAENNTEVTNIEQAVDFKCSITIENPAKEFDKKVRSLIYEDQEMMNKNIISPKNIDVKRTVLTERNVIERTRSTLSKLKVNDKPTMNKYDRASKIPVFLNKKLIQCENTPPRNMTNAAKEKQNEWDTDTTLII